MLPAFGGLKSSAADEAGAPSGLSPEAEALRLSKSKWDASASPTSTIDEGAAARLEALEALKQLDPALRAEAPKEDEKPEDDPDRAAAAIADSMDSIMKEVTAAVDEESTNT